MPLILSGNVASATAAGYEVANSCRFNDDDSAYMTTTGLSTPTSKRAATFSFWIKRGNLGINTAFFGGESDSNDYGQIGFDSSDNLQCYIEINGSTELNLVTSAVYRDPSAWMHIALIIDGSQGTAANRAKLYVNGTQVTAFGTAEYMSQNTDLAFLETHLPANAFIGVRKQGGSLSRYFDGYIAEAVYLDGTIAAIGDLGEFDEDSPTIWKPKDVSGLTFGNNGFYLDFEDSGDLDDDESGNGNDFTASNLAATDQATDTPTLNYATFNPLIKMTAHPTFTEGNLKITNSLSNKAECSYSTIAVSSGKWYAEFKCSAGTVHRPGISSTNAGQAQGNPSENQNYPGMETEGWGWYYGNGYIYNNGSATITSGYDTFSSSDIVSVGLDCDNMRLYFGKNGTWQNSADPAAGSGGIDISSIPSGSLLVIGMQVEDSSGGSASAEANFGSPPYAISSGNSDGDDYGNFEYAVPSGFYALNSKNLAEYGG